MTSLLLLESFLLLEILISIAGLRGDEGGSSVGFLIEVFPLLVVFLIVVLIAVLIVVFLRVALFLGIALIDYSALQLLFLG